MAMSPSSGRRSAFFTQNHPVRLWVLVAVGNLEGCRSRRVFTIMITTMKWRPIDGHRYDETQ